MDIYDIARAMLDEGCKRYPTENEVLEALKEKHPDIVKRIIVAIDVVAHNESWRFADDKEED